MCGDVQESVGACVGSPGARVPSTVSIFMWALGTKLVSSGKEQAAGTPNYWGTSPTQDISVSGSHGQGVLPESNI